MKTNTKYIIILSFLLVVLLILFDALVVEPYAVQTTENTFDTLGGNGETIKIVFISDTQTAYDNPEYFQRVIDIVNEQKPDLILIGGDIVDGEPRGWEKIGLLADLESKHGIYAVLGNHDYINWDCSNPESYEYADMVKNKVESLGIEVLRNEHRILDINSHRFALVGIDDLWACRADYDRAIDGIPDDIPRLMLSHNNEAVVYEELEGKNLILSGHTHCGQVRIPLITDFLIKERGFGNITGGRVTLAEDNEVYVSCGVTPGGIRFLNPPEISVIYLK